MCVFYTDLGTNSNFFLYNTKRLVFITEEESVYSAVRTESLYNSYVSSLKGSFREALSFALHNTISAWKMTEEDERVTMWEELFMSFSVGFILLPQKIRIEERRNLDLCNKTNKCTCIQHVLSHTINYRYVSIASAVNIIRVAIKQTAKMCKWNHSSLQ